MFRAFRVRTVGCDGTPEVARIDHIMTAPAANTLAIMADMSSLRAGLTDVGFVLSRGKTLALPPADHRVTSAEMQLRPMRISALRLPTALLSLICMLVRTPSFATTCIPDAPAPIGMPIFARHAAMENMQTATVTVGMSLALRTAYLVLLSIVY